jgi:hypothetical protein
MAECASSIQLPAGSEVEAVVELEFGEEGDHSSANKEGSADSILPAPVGGKGRSEHLTDLAAIEAIRRVYLKPDQRLSGRNREEQAAFQRCGGKGVPKAQGNYQPIGQDGPQLFSQAA